MFHLGRDGVKLTDDFLALSAEDEHRLIKGFQAHLILNEISQSPSSFTHLALMLSSTFMRSSTAYISVFRQLKTGLKMAEKSNHLLFLQKSTASQSLVRHLNTVSHNLMYPNQNFLLCYPRHDQHISF